MKTTVATYTAVRRMRYIVSDIEPTTTDRILASTQQWLKPLVHVLIRSGVTWREFAGLAKTVYVDVATRQFGKRGRPTNVSRTAILTGLAQREVRKERERVEAALEPQTGYVSKASLLLSAWHLDPQFLDAEGKPALLPLEGDGASFTALVKRCNAGDVQPSTLLKELRSAGAVRETADGRLEALRRSYVPYSLNEELVRLWGTVLADVATTYLHNLTREAKTPARFERAAVNDRVRASALPEFREFLNREGQAFLERVDAWLTAHEASGGRESATSAIRLGAGVYHIQD
jgi:hypothetical protein